MPVLVHHESWHVFVVPSSLAVEFEKIGASIILHVEKTKIMLGVCESQLIERLRLLV